MLNGKTLILFTLLNLVLSQQTFYPVKGNFLLGTGFEPLTFEPLLAVFDLKFNDQKMDLNHEGYIPDDVIQYNNPNLREEFYAKIVSWHANSTENTNIHINTNFGYMGITGKFSYDNTWSHRHLSNKFNRMATINAHIIVNTVALQIDNINFSKGFINHIDRIAHSLSHNTNASLTRAIWEGNQLLKKYGSTVIYKLDQGGELELNTVVDINNWVDWNEHEMKASTSINFNYIFKVDSSFSVGKDQNSYQKYNQSIVDTMIKMKGGEVWKEGQSFNDWLPTIKTNPASLNIYTYDILDLITPWNFPHLSPYQVEWTRDIIHRCLVKHLENNRHIGCMDPYASNFNPRANIHSEDACRFNRKYAFGGVYQTSTCNSYAKVNVLTQDFNCPTNFTAYPILEDYTLTHDWTTSRNVHTCHRCWLVAHCCHNRQQSEYHSEQCTVTPHMCLAPLDSEVSHGSAFGGIYTNGHINDVIGFQGCPKGFNSMIFPLSWDGSSHFTVCYALFDTIASDAGVNFGGIFSSDIKNPESGHYYCPLGFERHSLVIGNGKSIYYCIGMNDISNWQQYLPPGWGGSEPEFVDGYNVSHIIGNSTYLMTNITSNLSYEEQLLEVLKKSNSTLISISNDNNITLINESNQKSNKLSTGGIIGIIIGVMCFILSIIAFVIYKKMYNNHRSNDFPLINQTPYGT